MAKTDHNIRLSSAEIANIWTAYMSDSASKCVFRYFFEKIEDTEIRPVLKYTLELSKKHLKTLSDIFKHENFPVPHGFTEQDVSAEAAPLFSDTFILIYIQQAAKAALSFYSLALPTASRADIRDYFSECIASSVELYNRASSVLLDKGLYIKPPYIPTPESAEFVKKESFLNGFFGDRRPLNANEITSLYTNMQTNAYGKALILGFSQVVKDKEIRDYFLRGKELAQKQIEVYSTFLRKDDLPSPMTWDSDIMDSTEAPFSDKLMLYHIVGLGTAGMMNLGAAFSTSMRRDLNTAYVRLIAEIATFADDGVNMMINRGWMEKMPGAVDRKALALQ